MCSGTCICQPDANIVGQAAVKLSLAAEVDGLYHGTCVNKRAASFAVGLHCILRASGQVPAAAGAPCMGCRGHAWTGRSMHLGSAPGALLRQVTTDRQPVQTTSYVQPLTNVWQTPCAVVQEVFTRCAHHGRRRRARCTPMSCDIGWSCMRYEPWRLYKFCAHG